MSKIMDVITGRNITEDKACEWLSWRYQHGVELLYRYSYLTQKRERGYNLTDKDLILAVGAADGLSSIAENLQGAYDGMGRRKRNIVAGVLDVLDGYVSNLGEIISEAQQSNGADHKAGSEPEVSLDDSDHVESRQPEVM